MCKTSVYEIQTCEAILPEIISFNLTYFLVSFLLICCSIPVFQEGNLLQLCFVDSDMQI